MSRDPMVPIRVLLLTAFAELQEIIDYTDPGEAEGPQPLAKPQIHYNSLYQKMDGLRESLEIIQSLVRRTRDFNETR
jgi:hypothetical protein